MSDAVFNGRKKPPLKVGFESLADLERSPAFERADSIGGQRRSLAVPRRSAFARRF